MSVRIALAALLVAASPSVAAAQGSKSGTAGPLPAPPMKSAPASGQAAPDQSKSPPAAARSGKRGLRIGDDALNGDLLEIKRMK